MRAMLASVLGIAALAGCVEEEAAAPVASEAPFYFGIETRLLADDLVNFAVSMSGGTGRDDVEDYAKCAAAQYALIRGYGFTRHVRTLVDERAGIWSADAVYTISPALPQGSQTIDAEVTVADCQLRGIPTV